MRFLGRPLIEWQIAALRDQGVNDIYLAARGRSNRYQIREAIGYGEQQGVHVHYSPAALDRTNTGSGAATLDGMRHWGLTGLALVFPTDSVFEFDLDELVRMHRRHGALVTVASVLRRPEEVAGKYGVVRAAPSGQCLDFREKPTLSTARTFARDGEVATNASMYLIDTTMLTDASRHGPLGDLRGRPLDWGRDLLPWLIRNGYPVYHHPIGRLGDLGTPRDYLLTMNAVLRGHWPAITTLSGPATHGESPIHESTLHLRDRASGRTLADRIAHGLVYVGPQVRIGREVQIGDGAVLEDVDIGDGAEIGAGCEVRRSACQEGAVVGAGARVVDSYVGLMAEVRSAPDTPTKVDTFSALGEEVTVHAGARLTGVSVFPAVEVPGHVELRGATVTCTGDLDETERLAVG